MLSYSGTVYITMNSTQFLLDNFDWTMFYIDLFFSRNVQKGLNIYQWKEEKTSYILITKTFLKQIAYKLMSTFYDRSQIMPM